MDVTIVGGAPTGAGSGQVNTDAVINPTFAALHASVYPDEYQAAGRIMGHYSVGMVTAAIAPSAAAVMAAFRWADQSSLALIKRVRVSLGIVTAVTAQAAPDVDMIVARAYTVSETTNATVVSTINDTGKMRQSMGTSLANGATGQGIIQVASAAAGLTGGTKTLDGSVSAIAALPPNVFTIGGGAGPISLFDAFQGGQHPLALRQNEGILIRTPTAIATGTVKLYINIDWAEVPAY